MAECRSNSSGFRLDIQEIQLEAQHRWLRPAEICEILRNYRKFHIASEPPYKPSSGSLFLFDRKVLRYFRKDGHNWRKKKDGKTVREAHEKLKIGSVDMLHCYYAHGEEQENFQRRSYWMLEQDLMHIVFVHYLDVKGNKTSISCVKDTGKVVSEFQNDSPLSFSFAANYNKAASASTDSTSPTSTLTSTYEDAESEDNHQASSKFHSSPEVALVERSCVIDKTDAGLPSSCYLLPRSGSRSIPGVDYTPHSQGDGSRDNDDVSFMSGSQRTLDLASWEEVFEHCTTNIQAIPAETLISPNDITTKEIMFEQENGNIGPLLAGEIANELGSESAPRNQRNWQISLEDHSSNLHKWSTVQNLSMDSVYDLGSRVFAQNTHNAQLENGTEPFFISPDEQGGQPVQNNIQGQHSNAELGYVRQSKSNNGMGIAGNGNYSFIAKQPLLDGVQMEEGLKKADSFSRWIAKELGEVEDLHSQSNNGMSWSLLESGDLDDDSISTQLQLDNDSLNPSLSLDQLFSIVDFSPSWVYSDFETEVLITGTFLKSQHEVAKYKWSCMFGEMEVPAEIIGDGILRCYAPPHRAGLVPFYITCSNRLACSEVREFEYRDDSTRSIDGEVREFEYRDDSTRSIGGEVREFEYRDDSTRSIDDTSISGGSTTESILHMRLERLLSLGSVGSRNCFSESVKEAQNVVSKIITLMEEGEGYQMSKGTSENDFFQPTLKENGKILKEKLLSWILFITTEDVEGANVLDEGGQGVLHLAAALGYDWALRPILASGVNVNFRDVNGWTALHWAAFCGREGTVVALVSLGAAPGALIDPSPEFPLGRTPADLASENGYKGISGFLAESSLTTYLSSLTMNDPKEDCGLKTSGVKAVQTVSQRLATPTTAGELSDALSLKDSLAAVCNATQAASRIHQIFRMQSFQRKQFVEHGGNESGSQDERIISLLATRACQLAQNDGTAYGAAVCIQKKFRGWKKRREFLIIRQRIVKIQAHVRGHQVRKKYKSITWSVGILEKVILRWRRKRSGLRGFRSEAPSTPDIPSIEDEYDFLKEGRKQTEERQQKALARVKSMVQYPEARAQYRRLLTVAEEFRESKDVCDMIPNSSEDMADGGDEDLIDIETLLDDDIFMSIAFD